MAGLMDVLSGRRIDELKQRMEAAIEAEDKLVKELRVTNKKLDEFATALEQHKQALIELVNELRARR